MKIRALQIRAWALPITCLIIIVIGVYRGTLDDHPPFAVRPLVLMDGSSGVSRYKNRVWRVDYLPRHSKIYVGCSVSLYLIHSSTS